MNRILAMALAAALTVPAHGDIIYDNITANTFHLSVFSGDEYADDTTLSTGAGSIIHQVEVGVLRSIGFPGTYSGTMTVHLWADAGGTPGTLFGTATVPIVLADNAPHIVPASFNSVVAPTATIWTGVAFSFTTQLGAGLVEGHAAPSVGSTTGLRAVHNPNGSWSVFDIGTINEFLRISTVPTPGAAVVTGCGLMMWRRKRCSMRDAGARM
jgi:hypothetical protein